MTNVILAGVGGQGTVLAAKVLATAAAFKGMNVRSAETIGMSQRGGSVVSHVRMAPEGTPIHSSLVMHDKADMVIAFEPGEAARVLPYLAPSGTLVTATSTIEPVSAALGEVHYNADVLIEGIRNALAESSAPAANSRRKAPTMVVVDDADIIDALGGNRKVLNVVMLAKTVQTESLPINVDDLKLAVKSCVKPAYVEMNMKAIETALGM